MKKLLLLLGFAWSFLIVVFSQTSFAALPASGSGSTNNQYACTPPFVSQAAKPNIHFVVDITGSMKQHPYLDADNTYDTTRGYWGYFKQDTYYKYDVTANNYWQENPNCTNTDLIGTTNGAGQCISGKLLNYFTSNKYDIMRKILTGGRVWASDSTVLEHELGYASNLSNEATTNCDVNHNLVGRTTISSPDPTLSQQVTISSSSSSTRITVAKVGTTATFTRSGGSYTTTGIVPGTLIVTSGFSNAGNNGTWTVSSISSTVITVTSNTGIVAESNRSRVTIKTVPTTIGPVCKVLVNTLNVAMQVDATAKAFIRTDAGGSFIADGWLAGMTFDSNGFANSGNNKNMSISGVTLTSAWTVATVSASTITVTNNSGMVTNAVAVSGRLTQSLSAYIRVKSTTPEDFTGIIQTLYKGPGNLETKADLEVSFFDTSGGVDYTGGTTTNSTVKNQAQSNYINAINGSASDGATNTGPAMVEAEKFFKQVAVSSATHVPTSGTALIAPQNGASDPYYDPPATGTASSSNSSAASCRKSFVILISDGEWNNGTDPVGPAYNMNRRDGTSDLRPDTTEPALPGKQSVMTYTVYAFGDTAAGRNALITTAIFGGFTDIDNNALPYPFTSFPVPPPYSSTRAALKTASNTTGYADSTDVAGSTQLFFGDDQPTFPLDQCNPNGTWNALCEEWDKSPGPTHTGLPYNYFEATDGADLATAMINAVNEILKRTSSSTAASILGNNDNAGASLIQALFYPEKQFDGTLKASWIGEVQAFWYYQDPMLNHVTIREDSVADQKLKLNEDKITEFTFDGTYTKANLYADANGDGAADSYTVPPTNPDTTVELEKVQALWRAGRSLWARAASDRSIYTNDPTVTAVTGSRLVFDSTQATTLAPYLDVSTVVNAVPTATDVINYARGTDISSSYAVRQRSVQLDSTQSTWKLGDVIDSTPKMMSEVRLNGYNLKVPDGYGDTSYDKFIKSKDYSRRGTAFIGANDGMLHAFKTGTNYIGGTQGTVAEIKNADGSTPPSDLGKELWAFIPKNSLPYLQYLMLPGYQHMYFTDSTPLLIDAAIGMTTPDYKNSSNVTQSISTNPCNVATASTYYLCARRTTVTSGNQVDYSTSGSVSGTSWRTVLLGSAGLGGASSTSKAATSGVAITVSSSANTFTRTAGSFIADGWAVGKKFSASGFTNAANNSTFTISAITATVITCTTASGLVNELGSTVSLVQNVVKTPLTNLGYSSFFALDVTAESDPQLLWEFTDPRLGFSTVMPVVIRIKDPNDGAGAPRNGKWYAILASGPSGPIDSTSLAFQGKSELPLTIFVLDLKTGALVRTFNKLPATDAYNSVNQAVHTQVASMPDNAFGGSLSGASFDADRTDSKLPGFYSDDAVYIGYTKAGTASPIAWNKGGVLRLLTYNDPTESNWSVSKVIDDIGPITTSVAKLQDVTTHKLWLFFGTGRYFVKGDDPVNVNSLFGIQDPCFTHSTSTNSDHFSGTVAAPCTTTVSATSTATGMTGSSVSTLVDKSAAAVTATTVNDPLTSGKEGWYINLDAASGGNYPKRMITNPVASSNGIITFTTFTPSTNVCSYGGTTSVWAVKYDSGGVGSSKLKGQILLQLSTGAFQQIDVSSAFTQSTGRETVSYQGVPPKSEPAITSNANHFPSKRILHVQER